MSILAVCPLYVYSYYYYYYYAKVIRKVKVAGQCAEEVDMRLADCWLLQDQFTVARIKLRRNEFHSMCRDLTATSWRQLPQNTAPAEAGSRQQAGTGGV